MKLVKLLWLLPFLFMNTQGIQGDDYCGKKSVYSQELHYCVGIANEPCVLNPDVSCEFEVEKSQEGLYSCIRNQQRPGFCVPHADCTAVCRRFPYPTTIAELRDSKRCKNRCICQQGYEKTDKGWCVPIPVVAEFPFCGDCLGIPECINGQCGYCDPEKVDITYDSRQKMCVGLAGSPCVIFQGKGHCVENSFCDENGRCECSYKYDMKLGRCVHGLDRSCTNSDECFPSSLCIDGRCIFPTKGNRIVSFRRLNATSA